MPGAAYRGLRVVLSSSLAERDKRGVSTRGGAANGPQNGRPNPSAPALLLLTWSLLPASSAPHLSQFSALWIWPSSPSIRPTPPTGPPPRKNPYLAEEHPPIADVRITLAPINIPEIPPPGRARPLKNSHGVCASFPRAPSSSGPEPYSIAPPPDYLTP